MASQKGIQTQLQEGEELVWTGGPCEEKEYGKIDRILLPLSAVMLAVSTLFAMLTLFAAARWGFSTARLVELVLLLVVGGISVYSYFFRFAVKRRRKADLVYGVTNRCRVLIRDTSARRTYEYDGSMLRHIAITELDRNGVGTIYLTRKGAGNLLDNTGLDFFAPGHGAPAALFDIPDCRRVYRLIRGRLRE